MEEKNELRQILYALEEIRDDQRTLLEHLKEQGEKNDEHQTRSREAIAQSMELQKAAVSRAKVVLVISVPAILACIGAILYLIYPYL